MALPVLPDRTVGPGARQVVGSEGMLRPARMAQLKLSNKVKGREF